MDDFGKVDRMLSRAEHEANVEYLTSRMAVYFEFPAIRDSCDTGRPVLVGSDAELQTLGLPAKEQDVYGYLSLFPPLVELLDTATA